jgi:outer membrane protein assembly factor BamA
MRWAVAIMSMILAFAHTASADPPATRGEMLRQQRADKAAEVRPHEPGAMERGLLKLEQDRLIERLLSPPDGFFPLFGHIAPNASLSLGAGYKRPGLFGPSTVLWASAMGSFNRYWLMEVRLEAPELRGGIFSGELYGRTYGHPEESFFGLGPASLRRRHSSFALRNVGGGGTGSVRLTPSLSVGGLLERTSPSVGRGTTVAIPALQETFDVHEAPGLDRKTAFNRLEIFADFNYRTPRANPRRGGRYRASYTLFDDTTDLYGFRRVELDIQQYIPFLEERRVLALRALASASAASHGQQVPFYMMRTLGGPDDLRGFRRYRFRDSNLLLLQAEYRWEVFTAMDAAIFFDAGQVASRFREISMAHLQTNYGFGVRFGSVSGVFLRIEGAFGSRDGEHFVFRFGHVF